METRYCTSCGKPIAPGEFLGVGGRCIDCAQKAQAQSGAGAYSDKGLAHDAALLHLSRRARHSPLLRRQDRHGHPLALHGGVFGVGALVDIILIANRIVYG